VETKKEPGFAVWLTGLPASGKTTLARALAQALAARGVSVQILDSDELRRVLTPQPTYSASERDWFYQTMVFIGQLLVQNGVNVLFAATASRRRYRDRARQAIERFMEVYVHCSLETCMARDEKGIYAKGLAGKATTVPGLQVPYQEPQNPALTIDTERQTPEEGVRAILARLEERSFLKQNR
jgi:adenylylsulfate kinase